MKGALVKALFGDLFLTVAREAMSHGLAVAEMLMSDEDIKHSALYEAMDGPRKITMAKAWRKAQRLKADTDGEN